jgi:hypothetical protein
MTVRKQAMTAASQREFRIERGKRKIERIVARAIREVMAEGSGRAEMIPFWWVFGRPVEVLDRVMAKISDADGLPVDEDIIAAVVANADPDTLGQADSSRRRGRRRSKSRPA